MSATRRVRTLAALALLATACQAPNPGALREGQPTHVTMVRGSFGRPGQPPGLAVGRGWVKRGVHVTKPAAPLRDLPKVHPRLLGRLARQPPNTPVMVLVTFRDSIWATSKIEALQETAELADSLRDLRANAYDALAQDLAKAHGATEIRRYWLIHAMLLRLSLGEVPALAQRPDVIRVEPLLGGPPPDNGARGPCGTTENTVANLRERIHAGGFSEWSGGRIALLDTGVRSTHVLLADGGLGEMFDCGIDGCSSVSEQSDGLDQGHGTASAAILVGKSSEFPEQTGLTGATLDSYKVYGPNGAGGLEVVIPAALEALQHAYDDIYDVAVVEIAVPEGGASALTEAARHLFQLGRVVVVANGNDGDEIPAPASAVGVLGVGGYCVQSGSFVDEWVHGWTTDGRLKPDLSAPTSAYVAANKIPGMPEDRAFGYFGGTSGATPVAAGAGLLLRNWMSSGDAGPADPGALYSVMLLSADEAGAAPEEGAGRAQLPESGTVTWGRMDVKQDERVEIEIPTGEAANATVEVVLWWASPAETADGTPTPATRSDIDLYLLDAGRKSVGTSLGIGVSMERTIASGPAGYDRPWAFWIHGASVPGEPQTVYWATRVTEASP